MKHQFTQRVSLDKKYCPTCHNQYEGSISECPKDKTPLRGGLDDPYIGKMFADRYEIESILGFGGMSVVYKARHKLMDRIVAIKMLHNKLKDDHTAKDRFQVEAQACSSLNHQNVITVYDFGVTADGEPFFVMDCLEGESLKDLIERKYRLTIDRALPIFRQIADGLDAAHKKGIVHRDLKPANVVLVKQDDGSECVKLVDFGIAKVLPQEGREQHRLTQTGEVFGSPLYMSPEQCKGKELDARSDIYALGCLMYETLSGVPPFEGGSFLETMNMHVGDSPRPINEVEPDAKVPRELEDLILKCMEKNPERRFQTAAEARDMIAAVTVALLGHSGKHMAGISLSTMALQRIDRRPSVSMVMSSIMICMFVVAAIFLGMWPGPADDRGTPLNKMVWNVCMYWAERDMDQSHYAQAEHTLQYAEIKASKFSNKERLESTLKTMAELYDKWEGHAELLERTNFEISQIEAEKLTNEFKKQMALLASFDRPSESAVRETSNRLRAEAQIPSILSTAAKLSGKGMFAEQEQLLRRASHVEKRKLGNDSPSVAQLDLKLAECLLSLRKNAEVRSLLLHAATVLKQHAADMPDEYVRVLNRLGQFDLDQNDFTRAEPELKEALDMAKSLRGHRDIVTLCLRSYSDVLQRTNRKDEAARVIQEADQMDRPAQ